MTAHSNQSTSEFIYLVHCPETNLYKIGVTSNPKGRMAQLLAASAFPMEMVAQYQCPAGAGRLFEAALHKTFSDKRTHGEWFRLNESDLEMFEAEDLMAITLTKCGMCAAIDIETPITRLIDD